MKFSTLTLISLLALALFAIWHKTLKTEHYTMIYSIKTIDDILKIFPKSVGEIKSLAAQATQEAEKNISELIKRPSEQRTIENTLYGFDKAYLHFRQAMTTLEALVLLSPDDLVRTAAEKESVMLQKKFIDLFSQNKPLYDVLNEFYE